MNIPDLITRSTEGLLRNRTRTVFTTMSITVAAFSLTTAIGINQGGGAYVEKFVNASTEAQSLWVMKKQDSAGSDVRPSKYSDSPPYMFHKISVKPLTSDDLDKIRSVTGVTSTRPYIVLSDAYVSVPNQDNYQAVMTAQRSNDPIYYLAGTPGPLNDQEVLLPDGYREALRFASPEDAVGSSIVVTIMNRAGPKETKKSYTLKVRAVVRESYDVLTEIPTSLRVSERTLETMNNFSTKNLPIQNKYLAVTAKVDKAGDLGIVRNDLISKGYEAQTREDTDKGLTQFANMFERVMILFGSLAVITAIFGITNTQYMSVAERIQEIGLMKALGMSRTDVKRLFRIEAGLIGFFGGCIGAALAVIFGNILNPLFIKYSQLDPDNMILRFSGVELVVVILGLTIVATIAGLSPAKKASGLDPVAALRNEEM